MFRRRLDQFSTDPAQRLDHKQHLIRFLCRLEPGHGGYLRAGGKCAEEPAAPIPAWLWQARVPAARGHRRSSHPPNSQSDDAAVQLT